MNDTQIELIEASLELLDKPKVYQADIEQVKMLLFSALPSCPPNRGLATLESVGEGRISNPYGS